MNNRIKQHSASADTLLAQQSQVPVVSYTGQNTRLRIFTDKKTGIESVHIERAPRKKGESLKNYDIICKEVQDFLKEHNLKDMPSAAFFRKFGRGDIVSSASVYFEGTYGLRAEMILKGDLKLE